MFHNRYYYFVSTVIVHYYIIFFPFIIFFHVPRQIVEAPPHSPRKNGTEQHSGKWIRQPITRQRMLGRKGEWRGGAPPCTTWSCASGTAPRRWPTSASGCTFRCGRGATRPPPASGSSAAGAPSLSSPRSAKPTNLSRAFSLTLQLFQQFSFHPPTSITHLINCPYLNLSFLQ